MLLFIAINFVQNSGDLQVKGLSPELFLLSHLEVSQREQTKLLIEMIGWM